jgi:hypothetical protein
MTLREVIYCWMERFGDCVWWTSNTWRRSILVYLNVEIEENIMQAQPRWLMSLSTCKIEHLWNVGRRNCHFEYTYWNSPFSWSFSNVIIPFQATSLSRGLGDWHAIMEQRDVPTIVRMCRNWRASPSKFTRRYYQLSLSKTRSLFSWNTYLQKT